MKSTSRTRVSSANSAQNLPSPPPVHNHKWTGYHKSQTDDSCLTRHRSGGLRVAGSVNPRKPHVPRSTAGKSKNEVIADDVNRTETQKNDYSSPQDHPAMNDRIATTAVRSFDPSHVPPPQAWNNRWSESKTFARTTHLCSSMLRRISATDFSSMTMLATQSQPEILRPVTSR